jgi:Fur family ferric uptake transcriptional regulator
MARRKIPNGVEDSADLDELRDAIRARRLRATPARIAVLRLLRRTGVPMRHDEIYGDLQTRARDRSTIYRALNQLSEVGLLRRVDLGDRVWRFGAVRADRGQHAFRADFVCSKCGTVLDLSGVELAVSRVAVPRAVARGQIELRLIGPCNDCLEPRRPDGGPSRRDVR